MYKIGYIKGYNRENSIRFQSAAEQQEYFNSHVISNNHIIDAYYPPHYTNKIKININEHPLDCANFVIIVYRNEYYYYFIDHFTYINEDIVTIDISMDTFQTLMFNTKINFGELERLTIPRWKSVNSVDVINRNYIRENISVGNFINTETNVYGQYNFMVVIRNKYSTEDNKVFARIVKSDGMRIVTGIVIELYLLPTSDMMYQNEGDAADNFRWTLKYPNDNTSYDFDSYTFNATINNLLANPNVHNIYVGNNRSIHDMFNITISTEGTEKHTLITPDNTIRSASYGSSIILKEFFIKTYFHTYTLSLNGSSFTRNNSQHAFDLSFIPQLIDENYIGLLYGERKSYSMYPLHKLNRTSVQVEDYFDMYEGIRGYHIRETLNQNQDGVDTYDTWVVNSLPVSFNLINSAWANYAASHKASLVQGRDLAYDELTAKMGMNMLTAGLASYETSFDSRKDSSVPLISGLTAPLQNIISSKALATKYKVHDENLKNTPNTIGQGVSLISDLVNGCTKTTLKTFVVSDIEAVAKYFETYGFKVKKYINNTNIYDLPKNRYYYNFYKFDNVSLFITGSTIPNSLLGDLMERLTNGIRLFENKPNTLEIDYTKDNYDITYES